MRSKMQKTILAFGLWLLGHSAAALANPTILVFGDSLSAAFQLAPEQGWVHLLGLHLGQRQPPWRVLNASISGETTDGGAARLDAVLDQHQPDIVLLELGANDGLRGLPTGRAEQNLDRMIRAARSRQIQVLLIGIEMPPNYGPDYTEAFRAVYRNLADRHQVVLLPFLLEPVAADRRWFLEDNIHPTAEAQPALRDHVLKALEPLLLKASEARPAR